jgi:RNA polymerase sigma-70 factor, ECF subfamily
MDRAKQAKLEAELRTLFDAGELGEVATRAIKAYGPEVYSFIGAMLRRPPDAADAFARMCEKLWRNLPAFRWDCSMRTWVYMLARYVLADVAGEEGRRPRHTRISREARSLAATVRSSTPPYRKSEVKDKFAKLRERLEPDDQTLLILRVDRDLSWADVARVMDGASEAALRKRFERLKERLKELAKEEGLLR